MAFYPCVVFIQETDTTNATVFKDGQWHFYACGDFGNSKKNSDTMGMDPNNHKEVIIEIDNNTDAQARFLSGDFSEETWDGDHSFEFRYINKACTEEEVQAAKDTWIRVQNWVVNADDAEFKKNFENYFIKDAGSNNQPVYFSGGKPVAIGYTIAKSVPADAKFTDTNTWRGIQNNLTSDSTDQSLSAAQGKALKTLVDGKAPISHTHKKSQITDFPSSMPASDVYAWAKAATKPSYTKAEVGLGNVDNTADKNKSVNYATSAGLATNAQCLNNDDKYMKFHWSGQKGQPTWLWGGNDSGDMYVYNPSNFNVNYATTAGNGTVDFQTKVTTDGYFGAVRFGNGVQICWFTMKSARNRTFLLPFADINYAIAFSGGYCWLNINNRTTTGFTVGVEWSGYENSYIAIGRWK